MAAVKPEILSIWLVYIRQQRKFNGYFQFNGVNSMAHWRHRGLRPWFGQCPQYSDASHPLFGLYVLKIPLPGNSFNPTELTEGAKTPCILENIDILHIRSIAYFRVLKLKILMPSQYTIHNTICSSTLTVAYAGDRCFIV